MDQKLIFFNKDKSKKDGRVIKRDNMSWINVY